MKKILTFVFILFLLKVSAQTSVTAVSICGQTQYIRVTFTDEFIPVHNTLPVSCPDGTIHYNTEESQNLVCKMELFADAACSIPVNVDPRYFAYCNCITASHGTRIQPTFLNLPDCAATIPVSSEYKDNWRIDRYLIFMDRCTWDCTGYNCSVSGEGTPTTYNIVMNCCFGPKTLAVHLVSFEGVRRLGTNMLSWLLENRQDFSRLLVERSFDGVRYDAVCATSDVSLDRYADTVGATAYYRLRVYNTNGTFFFSPVVVLKAAAVVGELSVSPSPFKDVLQVSVSCGSRFRSVIKLVSMEGKTVYTTSRELRAGVNNLIINTPPVCKGFYILSVSYDGGTVRKKVLKQ
jgi:hypothetical protein